MKRRQFLQTGSVVSLPLFLGGMEVSAITRSSLFQLINPDDDRVLVLVQLNGGNDGLNMVIPVDQYSGLSQVRPNLLLPENSLLKLSDKTALHPAMQGMQKLFQEESLAVVQSVGYPNQNRSHFRSTDIWTSASSANEYVSSGWVGRYLDERYPGFPEEYPNAEYPDPFAITLGNVVSETCQGPLSNFSFTLTGASSIRLVEETVAAPSEDTCYGKEVDFIRTTIKQSNEYANTVLKAFEKGNNVVDYPQNNRLAEHLKTVATLISGGLKTRIYVVTLGGFDTHANQVLIGEPENGDHANLLGMVSSAVTAFVNDCRQLGVDERVVGMTFSEFGRQIRANASFGTDHGTAAPLLVFGSCIRQGIYGQNPEIKADTTQQEGVPMQYDFRSVYASLLIDWFGAKEEDVRNILFSDFQKIPFIKDCASPSSINEAEVPIEAVLSPNPCTDGTVLRLHNSGRNVRISILDALGSELQVVTHRNLVSGDHEIRIDMPFNPGVYYVRVGVDHRVRTLRVIKI
jgi:uncharacterized protein (DUF1501 family)